MGRLVLGGVAWLAALVLVAAFIQHSMQPRPLLPTISTSDLARRLNRPLPSEKASAASRGPQWIVTDATSARHALVAEVHAVDTSQASAIAVTIVERAQGRYDEILVYVRPIGAVDEGARRVQWTRRGGYQVLRLD